MRIISKPEGFCDEAWKAIYQYAFALAHGAGSSLFYYGDWIRQPNVAICSCNDGLRPVIMKLEALDEEGILGGYPLDEHRILWCCTEMNSKEEIDRAAAIVKGV